MESDVRRSNFSKTTARTKRKNVKSSKAIDTFVQRYKEQFWVNEAKRKNCTLKAKIISVWPPYGLALPKEVKHFELGLILFHRCRIVDHNDNIKNVPSRTKIRSKNISKYGIYSSKKHWPNQFQIGSEISIRISVPLNECSNRWRKQSIRDDDSGTNTKLSDFVQYKAIKVWNASEQFSNCSNQDEPVLQRKGVKFDQMKQLYSQWNVSKDFCLKQLLGDVSQNLMNDFINDNYVGVIRPSVFITERSKNKCSIFPKERNKTHNTNSRDSIIKELHPSSDDNNSMTSTKSNNCNCDTSIWIELEPIAETESIVECFEGILNIDSLASQGL
jgi:hypothetical protein